MQLSLGLSLVQLSRDGREGKYDPWGVYDVLNPPSPHPAFLQTCANSPPVAAVQNLYVFRGVLTEVLGGSAELLCVSVPAGSWSPMMHSCTHTQSHTPIRESSSRENTPSRIPLLSRSFHFTVCSLSQHPFLCFTDCFSLCLPSFLVLVAIAVRDRPHCNFFSVYHMGLRGGAGGLALLPIPPMKRGKKAIVSALSGNLC